MFSPQQGHPTFAPPLFAHFVPAPGSQHPPGALIALPPRPAITHRPSQEQQAPQDGEDPPEAADNELLKKILLAVSKISHQVRHNEKALRDITSRQSAIEDRLSLMEQRVLRADTRVLEMFEQDKDIHDNLKKSLYEVGCVADEVRGLRMSSAKEEGFDTLEKTLTASIDSSRDACIGRISLLEDEVRSIKKAFEENRVTPEAIPTDTSVGTGEAGEAGEGPVTSDEKPEAKD